MSQRIIDLHAARAGRPRRTDAPFLAWRPSADILMTVEALRDLLLRTDLYELVGGVLSPGGVVGCASGLTSLLRGGVTYRLPLTAPVHDTEGL